MQTLNKEIKTKEFRKVYLLYGDEAFLKRSYKKRFREAVTPDASDMNYVYYEGRDTDVSEVTGAADTMPFFADKKLIIIENSGWFKTGRSESAVMADYLDCCPDTAVIVFIEDEADKRNRLYKKIDETGYICRLDHPTESAMEKWAGGILNCEGKKITLADMQYFLSLTGLDMQKARNELDKLISYTGSRDVITRADIDAITTATETNRIFDMVRDITQGRRREAMTLYSDLLSLKEPPMRILFLIARQFDQLLSVKDHMMAGHRADQIASALKIPSRAVEGMMRQVRNYDRSLLISYVERCVQLEEDIKTGNIPEQLAVELIICADER